MREPTAPTTRQNNENNRTNGQSHGFQSHKRPRFSDSTKLMENFVIDWEHFMDRFNHNGKTIVVFHFWRALRKHSIVKRFPQGHSNFRRRHFRLARPQSTATLLPSMIPWNFRLTFGVSWTVMVAAMTATIWWFHGYAECQRVDLGRGPNSRVGLVGRGRGALQGLSGQEAATFASVLHGFRRVRNEKADDTTDEIGQALVNPRNGIYWWENITPKPFGKNPVFKLVFLGKISWVNFSSLQYVQRETMGLAAKQCGSTWKNCIPLNF